MLDFKNAILCTFCESDCEGGKDVKVVFIDKANFSLAYSGTLLHYSNICLIILWDWPSIEKEGLQNLQIAIKCCFPFFHSSDLWKYFQIRLLGRGILKNKKKK